ncbi:MAG: hypothetical protein ABJB74_03060 [Gemmatimonas sp.]
MHTTESLRPIRVGLAVIPQLAREILRDTFARHSDFEVLDVAQNDTELLMDDAANTCDVIIGSTLPADTMGPLELHRQFGRADSGTLFVLVDDAVVSMAEMRAASRVLDPAPDALVQAIRTKLAALQARAR